MCAETRVLRTLLWNAQCSVGGVSYGIGVTEIERAAARREGKPLPDISEVTASSSVQGTSVGSNGLSGGSAACHGEGAESPLNVALEGNGRQGASRGGVPGKGKAGGALGGSRAALPANGSAPPGSAAGVSSGGAGAVGGAPGGGTAAPGRAGAPARRPMGFTFVDARLTGGAWQREARPALLREFFRVLAVCHTVIPDGARRARHAPCIRAHACHACRPCAAPLTSPRHLMLLLPAHDWGSPIETHGPYLFVRRPEPDCALRGENVSIRPPCAARLPVSGHEYTHFWL